MANRCRRIADSGVFQGFILVALLPGIRENVTLLRIDLEQGGVAPAKTRIKRPTKGGRMRA